MKISAILVNYNSTDSALKAIGTLLADYKDVEVIVVDNASRDMPSRIESKYNVKMIYNKKNRGFAGAVNQGIRVSTGEYILLFNPDTLTPEGTVEKLLRFMEEHPEAGMISPQLYLPGGIPQMSARRFPKLKYLLFGRMSLLTRLFPQNPISREFLYEDTLHSRGVLEVEALLGAYLLIRRKALEDTGLLDEGNFFLFVEDVDLSRRMREKGWKLYLLREIGVIHDHGITRRLFRFKSEYHKRKSVYRYFRKYSQNPLLPLVLGVPLGFSIALLAFQDLIELWKIEPHWKNAEKH